MRGRRVKLFAPRFVSLLCAALLVALWAAQVSGAYQDPDPTPTQTPAPARTQQPPAAVSQPQTTTAQQPQATTTAGAQQQQPQPPTPAPTPAPPRVVRAYNSDALFQPTPAPTPTPQPTPRPTPCPPNTQCPTPTPTPGPTPVPFVDRDEAMSAGLNDIVVVEVARLKDLLLRSKCLREKADGQTEPVGGGCKPQPILLFLDGRPLRGMPPESTSPELFDGENGRLRYHLQRPVKTDAVTEGEVDDTKEHWADLLGLSYDDVFEDFSPFTRPVSVSVGLADEYPVETDVEREGAAGRFNLVRVHLLRFLWWLLLLAVFGWGFLRLARKQDIIRDRKPIAWERGNRRRKAYSLGRAQIAWWTFFVAFGFVFIWLVTGQYDLSPSVLVLLGISIVTTTGAIAIDKSRTFNTAGETGDTSADLSALLHEKEVSEQELTRDEGKIPEADFRAKADKYTALISNIRRRFPTALGWPSHRFDIDIVSDANGVSIHRFQMVLWTVVLGFVFVHEVLTRLSMPEFSGTLLLLMGISNGTYLFGKSSEPQATPPPITPPDTTQTGTTNQTNPTDATGATNATNTTNATGATDDTGEAAEAGETDKTGGTGETGASG